MKTPRNWRKLQRHQLSAEYPDVAGAARQRAIESIAKHGIFPRRKILLFEGKIIDGWQLHTWCIEANHVPEYEELKLPKGMAIEDLLENVQENRRHETQEIALARAVARRERVAKARQEGQSIRTIAESEGVSVGQVQRDLEKAPPTVSPDTVTGKDGRQQPAEKPKSLFCDRCTRIGAPVKGCKTCEALRHEARHGRQPGDDTAAEAKARQRRTGTKNGQPTFSLAEFNAAVGSVVRQLDRLAHFGGLARENGGGRAASMIETPEYTAIVLKIREVKELTEAWHKSLTKAKA